MDPAVAIVTVGDHSAALAELLAALPAPELAPYEWLTREDAVAVAVASGAVVGAGFVHAGELHPTRAWAAVLVDTMWRRRGIGTALYNTLLAQSPLPVRGKVESANSDAVAFSVSLGLTTLVTSHLVRVPAGSPTPTVEWPAGVHLEEISLPPMPEVRRAVAALYERIHAWDPVASGSDDTVADALCGDVEYGSVAMRDADIVGVGLAHRCAAGSLVEAAMVGTVEPDAPGAPITVALLAALLARGDDVEVEVDEGEGGHDELMHVLRQVARPPWPQPTLMVGSA